MDFKHISAWECRRHLGKYMDEVVRTDRPIIVDVRGKPTVAMVPVQLAEKIYRWMGEVQQTTMQVDVMPAETETEME